MLLFYKPPNYKQPQWRIGKMSPFPHCVRGLLWCSSWEREPRRTALWKSQNQKELSRQFIVDFPFLAFLKYWQIKFSFCWICVAWYCSMIEAFKSWSFNSFALLLVSLHFMHTFLKEHRLWYVLFSKSLKYGNNLRMIQEQCKIHALSRFRASSYGEP